MWIKGLDTCTVSLFIGTEKDLMDNTELDNAMLRARYAIRQMASEWNIVLSDDELNWMLGNYMDLLGDQDNSTWRIDSINAVAKKFESMSTKYSREARWMLMGMRADFREQRGKNDTKK